MGSTRPLTTLVLALAAPAVVLGVAAATPPASAAPPTIVVDTWHDEVNADGDCSLREAVAVLNTGSDVDGCVVPLDSVIDLATFPAPLSSTLVVSETMTIRGTGVVPMSIQCGSVVGNCIENVGAGSDLDLEHLWVSMAPGHQVYGALGSGHIRLQDTNVWGGTGGVVNQGGETVISHSTVWDSSDWGIFSLTGDVTLDHATLGGHDSGAVYADLADVTVSSSVFYDNEGYAIFGQSGDIDVVNTTIHASGADATRTDDGTISVRSTTIVGNRRAMNVVGSGSARASNTVVAQSTTANCAGTIVSDGFNVDDGTSCGFGEVTDRAGIDPGLGPFDGYALSPSIPLAAGSALIDTGGDCPALDQIDAVRPTDGNGDGTAACDVGAVETPAVAGPPAGPDAGETTDASGSADPLTPAVAATPVSARPTFTG